MGRTLKIRLHCLARLIKPREKIAGVRFVRVARMLRQIHRSRIVGSSSQSRVKALGRLLAPPVISAVAQFEGRAPGSRKVLQRIVVPPIASPVLFEPGKLRGLVMRQWDGPVRCTGGGGRARAHVNDQLAAFVQIKRPKQRSLPGPLGYPHLVLSIGSQLARGHKAQPKSVRLSRCESLDHKSGKQRVIRKRSAIRSELISLGARNYLAADLEQHVLLKAGVVAAG